MIIPGLIFILLIGFLACMYLYIHSKKVEKQLNFLQDQNKELLLERLTTDRRVTFDLCDNRYPDVMESSKYFKATVVATEDLKKLVPNYHRRCVAAGLSPYNVYLLPTPSAMRVMIERGLRQPEEFKVKSKKD